MSGFRIGSGFDAHRLVSGRPLLLGGVSIPSDRGLEGHSDGDCLIHAVCDALLGAVSAGDMGAHFPSSDAAHKGAASVTFLKAVRGIVAKRGFVVVNVDTTVVAETPRLSPHLDAMRSSLARALDLPLAAVSVKAKSADGLGALGRGEGIAAHAVALVARRPARRGTKIRQRPARGKRTR